MKRMNSYFDMEVNFIALFGPEKTEFQENGVNYRVLRKRSGIPKKIQAMVDRRALIAEIHKICLNSFNEKLVILCHYLTNAVILKELWECSSVRGFVHAHGHDVTWDRKFEKFPILPAHGPLYKSRVKSIIGKVKIISNSYATKDKLLDFGFPEADINVKYLGVELNDADPMRNKNRPEIKVLYLGRLTDFKGPVETILAFELACKKGLKATLNIVGDGPLKKTCETLIRDLDLESKVTLHGAVDEVTAKEFYLDSDIFTAHNKHSKKTGQEEAFGVTVIEAMSYGLPVITGKSGGVKETISDGETGILFEPGNIEMHSNLLFKLCSDESLRYTLGTNGKNRVLNFFSYQREKEVLNSILFSD